MPELPEVETIKSQLKKLIIGRRIKDVKISLAKMVRLSLARFKKIVIGAEIKNISRRAKILIIGLSNNWSLLIHLKLSGRLIFREKNEPLGPDDRKWNHLIYYFKDGSRLFHNDLRQFGYVKLVKSDELYDFFEKEGFGPEPLEKDFIFDDFLAILKKRPNAKIKQFLMDQRYIAGIGNIYSDEILFFAGVHPLKKITELKNQEIKKIFDGIRKILPQAIKLRGSSQNDYIDAKGEKGKFVPYLKAYGREGEKCKKCKAAIRRIKIVGRSAHFCPICQRL